MAGRGGRCDGTQSCHVMLWIGERDRVVVLCTVLEREASVDDERCLQKERKREGKERRTIITSFLDSSTMFMKRKQRQRGRTTLKHQI